MEAAPFDTGTAYAVGDYTIYGGRLYKFTSAHSAGAWNSSHVSAVDSHGQQQLNYVMAALQNAQSAAGFADTLALDAESISGGRYKIVITDADDPRN